MICEEASLLIGAAPGETTPELQSHLASCAKCSALRASALRLDERIQRAMQLGSPRMAPNHRVSRRGWALAASVLLAVVAGLLLWPAQSGSVLASELLQHVSGGQERESWDNTEVVAQGVLDKVLRSAGVSLDINSDNPVVYAHSCVLRGRQLPHLVIRTASGPVTVVPMPGEQLWITRDFSENGLHGVLLPVAGGAVAVIGRGQTDIKSVASDITRRIRLQR